MKGSVWLAHTRERLKGLFRRLAESGRRLRQRVSGAAPAVPTHNAQRGIIWRHTTRRPVIASLRLRHGWNLHRRDLLAVIDEDGVEYVALERRMENLRSGGCNDYTCYGYASLRRMNFGVWTGVASTVERWDGCN